MTADVAIEDRPTTWGVMRSRSVGQPGGLPEIVVVPGLAVANYLLPAVRELGTFARVHLVELPGFGGSGDPPHPLDVAQFADALAQWLDASGLDRPLLVGHSSGTQVAAHVAAERATSGLVLASPTVDPSFRSLPRVLLAWRRNHEFEPKSLDEQHVAERQRAGLRRVRHALKAHLDDPLEDVVPRVQAPVLVLYGDQDRLCTEQWARALSERAPDGRLTILPGAHSFPWTAPEAWSEPIERLARELR